MLLFAVGSLRTGAHETADAAAHRFAATAAGAIVIAATNAAVLLFVALLSAKLQGGVRARLRVGPSRATPVGVIAATVGTIGLSVAGGAASELLGVGHYGVMEMLETALKGAGPATLAAALAAVAVAPGIGEETFFRGLMQTRLVAALGRWPAIVIASLAFGLLHLDIVQGSLAFLIGLFLGWCAERLDGIRPTIVAHATNNAAFILSTATGWTDGVHGSSQAIAVALGLAVCGISTVVLHGRTAVRSRPPDRLASTSGRRRHPIE